MRSVRAKLGCVTGAQLPLLDHLGADYFALVGPAYVCEKVNEELGDVELITELAGGVIPGKGVVIIVESLAKSCDGDAAVFGRVDGLVVGSAAPHVGGRVDEPGSV